MKGNVKKNLLFWSRKKPKSSVESVRVNELDYYFAIKFVL